uniref:Uncharacterized protein n=1 Tax=Corvus moneduloides TaxID=1196302 RepID=A0A8C3DGN2_CORMO
MELLIFALQVHQISFYFQHIRKFINETWIDRHGSPLHPETIMLLWSFIVSVYGIGGLLGSLCCVLFVTAQLSENTGKYQGGQINLFFLVEAALLKTIDWYVGEISPKKLRGFTNSTVAHNFVSHTLSREILGSEALWPWLLASSGLSALVQLVTLPFFPDSPSYLLIQKGNEEACRKAIRKLWGEGDHQAEIDDIMKEKGAMASTKTLRVLEVIKERSLRWQLYILMTVMTTLQLCGINAVECSLIPRTRDNTRQHYKPLKVNVINQLRTVSQLVCIKTSASGRKYRALVILIFLFVVFYGIGPCEYIRATISVMVEIFSQSYRPSAFLIVGCINWMGLFVLGMVFPVIVDNLGPFCFLIFLGILALSAIFIYLYLPETKGKSIMEIKAEFNKLNFGKKETSVTENNFPKEQVSCTKL